MIDTLIEWLIGIVIIGVILRGVADMFFPRKDKQEVEVIEVKPRRRLK